MHLSKEQSSCYSFCFATKSADLGSCYKNIFAYDEFYTSYLSEDLSDAFYPFEKIAAFEFPTVHPTIRNMLELNDKSTEGSSLGPVVYIRVWHSQLLNFNLTSDSPAGFEQGI